MVIEIIEGVLFYPLSIINTTGGSVMHAIKGLDKDLPEFGECYFSTAKSNDPKAWKKHSNMTCNLFVPSGAVKFVFYDDRQGSESFGEIKEIVMSTNNYGRLVIRPNIWFGFASIAEGAESIILNVSNMRHDPNESKRLEPGAIEIPYNWTF
ncbi:hypothetical protein [Mucilaginibacter sp.]|uniref:hypothetical protein n=1 Tax=Mucilaginibacter sp. TaxID=1882438 RepID=UPI003D13B0DD